MFSMCQTRPLLVFVDDIHSHASPDAVGDKESADDIAYGGVDAFKEAGEEEDADCYVDYHHEDIEANAKSLRLAGVWII